MVITIRGVDEKMTATKRIAVPSDPTLDWGQACGECGQMLVHDQARGQVVCRSCGFVYQDQVLVEQWEDYERIHPHVGGPIPVGPATAINGFHDYRQAQVSNLATIQRLRQAQKRALWTPVRELLTGIYKVKTTCSALDLSPAITKMAETLFKRYYEQGSLRGHAIPDVAVAAIYITCLQHQVLIDQDRIITIAGAKQRATSKMVHVICAALQVSLPKGNHVEYHVTRLGNALGVHVTTLELATKMARQVRAGGNPRVIAGAIMYLACVQNKDSRPMAIIIHATLASDSAIRKWVKKLRPQLTQFLSPPDSTPDSTKDGEDNRIFEEMVRA
jgi:transcription initiation factor TFIIB